MPLDHMQMLTEFDKEPTVAILIFELFIGLGTAALLWLISRRTERVLVHYLVVAAGVLIFEIFTAPMWDNFKLGPWAYVYKDVSWVLTLGWSSLILGTIFVVDSLAAARPEWQRFVGYLVVLTVLTSLAEAVVVALGIRGYAPEVVEVISGSYVFGSALSLHLLYYVPVFMSLVIGFYKYWAPVIQRAPEAEAWRRNWLLSFVITFLGVFFFEVMIEPMVTNAGFPTWSYVYRDISVVMTVFWIALIWFATLAVDRYLPRLERPFRFALYLVVLSVIAYPIEAWFINSGFRVYGPSATANFTGFRTVITNIPVEVALAIPLYVALIIAFVRYWEGVILGGVSVLLPQPGRTRPPATAVAVPEASSTS